MKKVAKLLLIDPDQRYLLLSRSGHPRFGDDPDLPGGTVEAGEATRDAMVREVMEETGITVNADNTTELYAGTDYSQHATHYSLFVAAITTIPKVTISWEHSGYEWLSRDDLLRRARAAEDTYMQMVADVVTRMK